MFSNQRWTLAEIDALDVHFFDELMETEVKQEQEVYLDQVW